MQMKRTIWMLMLAVAGTASASTQPFVGYTTAEAKEMTIVNSTGVLRDVQKISISLIQGISEKTPGIIRLELDGHRSDMNAKETASDRCATVYTAVKYFAATSTSEGYTRKVVLADIQNPQCIGAKARQWSTVISENEGNWTEVHNDWPIGPSSSLEAQGLPVSAKRVTEEK
jgi:hypothetical protein